MTTINDDLIFSLFPENSFIRKVINVVNTYGHTFNLERTINFYLKVLYKHTSQQHLLRKRYFIKQLIDEYNSLVLKGNSFNITADSICKMSKEDIELSTQGTKYTSEELELLKRPLIKRKSDLDKSFYRIQKLDVLNERDIAVDKGLASFDWSTFKFMQTKKEEKREENILELQDNKRSLLCNLGKISHLLKMRSISLEIDIINGIPLCELPSQVNKTMLETAQLLLQDIKTVCLFKPRHKKITNKELNILTTQRQQDKENNDSTDTVNIFIQKKTIIYRDHSFCYKTRRKHL